MRALHLLMFCLIAWLPLRADAQDCSTAGCINLGQIGDQSGVNWSRLVSTANAFYGTNAKVYLVSSIDFGLRAPVFLREQEGIQQGQIQIPDIYHALAYKAGGTDAKYLWQYIVGHEMAHAFQERTGFAAALTAPFSSNVGVELHADFLAGFFMARQYGLSSAALDRVLDEVESLPTGKKGDRDYHGTHIQRVKMVSQGALLAVSDREAGLTKANQCAVDYTFQLLVGGEVKC